MNLEQLPEFIANVSLWFVTIVGAASLLVQAIESITRLTPSTRDDEVIGKIKRVLLKLQRLADKVALNPPADKARPGSK